MTRAINLIGQKNFLKPGKSLKQHLLHIILRICLEKQLKVVSIMKSYLKKKLLNYARIEKGLRKNIVDGKIYLRVKWKDYDYKFNSWILQDDGVKL